MEPSIKNRKKELWDMLRGVLKSYRDVPLLKSVSPDQNIPLSFSQERILAKIKNLSEKQVTYNIPVAYFLKGKLNILALEQSLIKIIERHQALRTKFISVNGEIRTTIISDFHFALQITDFKAFKGTNSETQIKCLIDEQALKPFDLREAPLLRCMVIQLEDQNNILLIVMCQAVADGWSVTILSKELEKLYQALCLGQPYSLPDLPIQYKDYLLWQRKCYQENLMERERIYWQKQLGGKSLGVNFPTQYSLSSNINAEGKIESFTLSVSTIEKLKQLSNSQGQTLFITLLSAFVTFCYNFTEQTEMILLVPNSGRIHAEVENLIGYFVNLIAIDIQIKNDNSTFKDLLHHVGQVVLQAFANQMFPFSKLTNLFANAPTSRVPVAFAFPPAMEIHLHELVIEPFETAGPAIRDTLYVMVEGFNQEFRVNFYYYTDLFAPSTVKRMASLFQTILLKLANNVDQNLSEFGKEQGI